MKKRIIIIGTIGIAFSLIILGFTNSNDSKKEALEAVTSTHTEEIVFLPQKVNTRVFTDFIYDVGTRFNPITKADLVKLRSFSDIIGEAHAQRIVNYNSVDVIVMDGDERSDIREDGNTNAFTNKQLQFLQSLNYSTSIVVWADYEEKNSQSGELHNEYWTPYFTIVPETQAEYSEGKEALITFLKEKSIDIRVEANVIPEKLQPAKLYFTVNKNGTVDNVRLDRTSNYPLVDKKMIKLIKNTPGKWVPAKNAEGDNVSQELVVSFGLMGC